MIVLIRDWLEASQMSMLHTEDYHCSSIFIEFGLYLFSCRRNFVKWCCAQGEDEAGTREDAEGGRHKDKKR